MRGLQILRPCLSCEAVAHFSGLRGGCWAEAPPPSRAALPPASAFQSKHFRPARPLEGFNTAAGSLMKSGSEIDLLQASAARRPRLAWPAVPPHARGTTPEAAAAAPHARPSGQLREMRPLLSVAVIRVVVRMSSVHDEALVARPGRPSSASLIVPVHHTQSSALEPFDLFSTGSVLSALDGRCTAGEMCI